MVTDDSRNITDLVTRFSLTFIRNYYTFSFKLNNMSLLKYLNQNICNNFTIELTLTIRLKKYCRYSWKFQFEIKTESL